jgi:hypothetical protein
MKPKPTVVIAAFLSIALAALAYSQELPPNVKKIKEGIYVYVGNNFNSNCGIVVTQEGVVLIDSGHNPTDSLRILDAVKKISPLPIRFLIDTEPHPDHTTGHFVFSPPATVIAHEGATESMINREKETPGRIEKLAAVAPEMRKALEGYRFVPPQDRVPGKDDFESRRTDIRAAVLEGRSQRGGHRRVAAQRARALFGIGNRRRSIQYSSSVRDHSRHIGRIEDDEGIES